MGGGRWHEHQYQMSVMVVEAFLLKLQTTDLNFMLMLVVRSGRVSMIHPLETMKVCANFHGNSFTNYFHLNQGIRSPLKIGFNRKT